MKLSASGKRNGNRANLRAAMEAAASDNEHKGAGGTGLTQAEVSSLLNNSLLTTHPARQEEEV